MRIFKSHPLLKLVNSYVIDSPEPANLSYFWNFGSLLGFCLVIQIITGVTLGMHYNSSALDAFNSVEHIMRDVNNGWLIRYLHSNTASAFFFIVYLHISRGLYYGSFKAPRTLVWTIGTVIFILMMATAFLGYVLPYGQMSLWGATVITNLMSAIPWVGQDVVEFIWGGFSVNNATLNRFFALHFVLPFVLAALALMHLIALHGSAGSNNPLGVSSNYDRLPFAPYFIFKDLITIFLFILLLSVFVFFMPNFLGDSENYVMANAMQTPPAIVPEWYLLPFYAILRSIPNKLLGVIAMFSAILILLAMPFTDLNWKNSIQFRPLSKLFFFIFVGNFLILMVLGAKHVESPFIELGQISTVIYFAHFLIIVPLVAFFENSAIGIMGSGATNYPKVETNLFRKPSIWSKLIKIWIYFKNYVKLLPILAWSNQNMILWVIRGIRVVYMNDPSDVDVDMPDSPASDGDSHVYPPSVVDPERMAEYNALHHELSLKMDTMDNSISKADEDLDSLDDYAKKKELKITKVVNEEGQLQRLELEASKGRQDKESFLQNAEGYKTEHGKIHRDIFKTEDLLKKTEKVNQDINKLDPEFSEDLKGYKDQISELKSKWNGTDISSESSESCESSQSDDEW